MPVTLGNVIYRARSKLDEPCYPTLPGSSPGSPPALMFSDTEINEWVGDGLRDIARRAEDLWTYDTTINIPAYGENPAQPGPTYSLDLGINPSTSDIIRINRIEFEVAGDSSQKYPLEASTQAYMDNIWNVDQLSTLAYPSYYVTRGYPGGSGRNAFVIQLFPNASQAGHLNIFYYRLPVPITDPVANPSNYTEYVDIIEGWDDLLIDYVHFQGLIKKRDPQWQTIQSLYEAKMVNIIDQTRRFSDQPQYFNYDAMALPWGGDSWGGW